MPRQNLRLQSQSLRWDIHAWNRCDASDASLLRFADRNAAVFWLARFKSDPVAMTVLRHLTVDLPYCGTALQRTGEDRLVEQLSWSLLHGIVHVHRLPLAPTAWRPVDSDLPAAPASSTSRAAVRSSSAQSVAVKPVREAQSTSEPDTFSARSDGAATAAVLRSAAVHGIPFCEECAKAAAVRQAGA